MSLDFPVVAAYVPQVGSSAPDEAGLIRQMLISAGTAGQGLPFIAAMPAGC